MLTLELLQDVQTRLERGGGGGGTEGKQREGREKCASLNKHTVETSIMWVCQHQQ